MFRIILLVLVVIFFIGIMFGCSQATSLQYQGKVRQVSEVEEMLADYLESENPNIDLDVNITSSFTNN